MEEKNKHYLCGKFGSKPTPLTLLDLSKQFKLKLKYIPQKTQYHN